MRMLCDFHIYFILLSALIIAGSCPVLVFSSSQAALLVVVYDDAGVPLSQVEVILEEIAGRYSARTVEHPFTKNVTDANGRVFWSHLNNGRYRIYVHRDGFSDAASTELELYTNHVAQGEFRLAPDFEPASVKIKDPFIVVHHAFPSVYQEIESEDFHENDHGTLQEQLMTSFMMVPDQNQNSQFSGSQAADTGLYLDDIPLINPIDRRVSFFPLPCFIDRVAVIFGGIDSHIEGSSGGTIRCSSFDPDSGLLHGRLGVSTVIDNSSKLASNESRSVFDYWRNESQGLLDMPQDTPDIENSQGNLMLSSHFSDGSFHLAGNWTLSDQFINSDFVNPDANESRSLWIKAIYGMPNDTVLKLISGIADAWLRPDRAFLLRGYQPLHQHDQDFLNILSWQVIPIKGFLMDIDVSGQRLTEKKMPDQPSSGRDGPSDHSPIDFPFYRDGRSDITSIHIKANRNTLYHGIEIGSMIQNISVNWHDRYHSSDSASDDWADEIAWDLVRNDWEFSLWGRDRWFATSNLELTTSMRWDRYHYLPQMDYLSPRIQIGYHLHHYLIKGGFERINAPPGFAYLCDDPTVEINGTTFSTPQEPQMGFRWFSGVERSFSHSVTAQLDGVYSLLTNQIAMKPIYWTDRLRYYQPIGGLKGKKAGIQFRVRYEPTDTINVSVSYIWSRSRVNFSGARPYSRLEPFLAPSFIQTEFAMDRDHFIPADNDYTHTIHGSTMVRSNLLWDMMFQADYYFFSGKPYTPQTEDRHEADFSKVNSARGPSTYRVDASIAKTIQTSSHLTFNARLSVRNAFDSWQGTPINASSGQPVFDPYMSSGGIPRTISLECEFGF